MIIGRRNVTLAGAEVYNLFAIAGRITFYLYEVRPPMSLSYIYEIGLIEK